MSNIFRGGKEGDATPGAEGTPDAFLGKGSKVVGTLTFTGPVELDGQVEGEISSQDKLTVGESAVITAKVSGSEIIIRGTVSGDISASKKLILKKPARITGNITTSNLMIEEGVVFEGKCSMTGGSTGERRKIEAVASTVAARG